MASPIPSAGSSERPAERSPALGGNPFGAGPFAWAHHALQIPPAWRAAFWRRGLLTVLVAWAPLALLAAIDGVAIGPSPHESLLLDFAAYGRYVLAAPAFAGAGLFTLPYLALVVRQFADARLVAERDRARYAAIVSSTQQLLCTPWVDAVLVTLAYVLTITVSPLLYPTSVATWVTPRAASTHLSLAGWWRTLVSQPLYYVLIGVWLWRLLLWVRFLGKTCRLELRLVAAHPDGLGGLRFVLVSIRAFAILGFGLGAIGAGSVANSVLLDGRPLWAFRYVMVGQALLSLLLLAAPVLLLVRPLMRLHVWGTFHYGSLAIELGQAFEQRWLSGARAVDADALGAPDFSATTDLYSIVANIQEINRMVLDVRTVALLTVASLLPYVPIVFAVMPVDDILSFALKAVT